MTRNTSTATQWRETNNAPEVVWARVPGSSLGTPPPPGFPRYDHRIKRSWREQFPPWEQRRIFRRRPSIGLPTVVQPEGQRSSFLSRVRPLRFNPPGRFLLAYLALLWPHSRPGQYSHQLFSGKRHASSPPPRLRGRQHDLTTAQI